MTHRCRAVGIGVLRGQSPTYGCRKWGSQGPFNGVRVVQFAGMVECGSKRIAGAKLMPKTVILLEAFYAEYPEIGKEIVALMFDLPPGALKEFLFEILEETRKHREN